MENVFNLKHKTILVTGASSGIGRQICITASEQGAKVILTGRNEIELNITRTKMNDETNHIILPFDLSDLANISTFVKAIA